MRAHLVVLLCIGWSWIPAESRAADGPQAVQSFHSKKCLANIGKAGVADCSDDNRLEVLPVGGATVMLRARANHCLFSNKDGRFAWFRCTRTYPDQHWVVVPPGDESAADVKAEPGFAMLRSAHSGKCLFSNQDGRFGLFQCTPTITDQYWSMGAPPASPAPAAVATASADTPMSGPDFNALVKAISDASFSADKQNALSLGVQGRTLTVAQVGKLIDLMPYSEDKMECLRKVRARISDKKNQVQLLAHFDYSEDKETATGILSE